MAEIHPNSSDSTTTEAATFAQNGEENLNTLLRSFVADVSAGDSTNSLIQRLKSSLLSHAPKLRHASANSARDLHLWTRAGGAPRALLVISVGSIALLSLTGLLVFVFFLLVATANAIIISFLVSLAAAGGFLAIFFSCLAAVYIGILAAAFFIISTTTISLVIAVLVATGWAGFFYIVWLASKKTMELAKHSVDMTSSAVSAYSAARRHSVEKSVD